MAEISVSDWLHSGIHWEVLAVMLALTYLLLATREKLLCWYAAFASSCIYTVIFWDVSLPMQALLNFYYVIMAVYGWLSWRSGNGGGGLSIRRWSPRGHSLMLVVVLLATALSGYWLELHAISAWPYVDSFITWASVITTWMVARKVLESWLYWVVINLLSVALYIERGLYPTALLFLTYTAIAIVGYFTWRRLHLKSDDSSAVLS